MRDSTGLKGVIVPVAVATDGSDRIDPSGLSRLVEFLLENRVDGIFVNGSMGSFALLPDSAQYRVIEFVAEQVAARVPMLAGASDTSTARVLEKIRNIQRLPIDFIVLLPPYYYAYQQKDLLRFFLTLADASEKPLILYENPKLTNNSISVDSIAKLAEHPNIAGVKFSVTDVLRWQELLRAPLPRARFSLICGAGRMSSLALQMGFDGITEGLHNIVPDLARNLCDACWAGDFVLADRIQQKINRCFEIFEIDGGWRGVEAAFQYMGICNRATLNPFDTKLAEDDRSRILDILRREGIRQGSLSLAKDGAVVSRMPVGKP